MTQDSSIASVAPPARFSGAGKLFLGFVVGALFGMAPVYYFYMGREEGLRSAAVGPEASSGTAGTLGTPGASGAPRGDAPPAAIPSAGGNEFASRMTYELRNVPAELPIAPPPPVPVAVAVARGAPATDVPPVPAIVVDPRPISVTPPPARDRTAAIEREGQRAEYRDASAPPPRVIEGREVKLPDMPTRAIVPGTSLRAEIEEERRRLSADVTGSGPAGGEGRPRQITVASAATRAEGKAPASATDKTKVVVAVAPIPAAALAVGGSAAGERTAEKGGATVDGRIAATRQWLSASAAGTHTIQLMGTHSEEHLKGSLRSLSRVLDTEKIYLFRTVAQGKPAITVVYGSYADRQAALQALEKLPSAIVANKPVLRTVNGIRAEMKQHKTGS